MSPYFVFNLSGIYSNPRRITGDFAFSTRNVPNDPDLLLVWGGEFVLRTDI